MHIAAFFRFATRFVAAIALSTAAPPATATAQDAAVDLNQIAGQRIDIRLTTGITLGDVEASKVVPGAAGAIRGLTIKLTDPPRQQNVPVQTIDEIFLKGAPLDTTYDKRTRELNHDPAKRQARLERQAAIDERMRGKRIRYWEEIPPDEQAKYVEEEKEFLERTRQTMGIPMQLLETKYYLFYTDMPLNTVGKYVQYLDQMYENLSKAFDYPAGKNVWRGKCAVVAFQNASDYHRFERAMMNNPNSEGSQGICHSSSNGRVVMACFKGTSEGFFATVLVHETSHGFMHRYKSTANIPSWIDEGVADWVAGKVVGKNDDEVARRQFEAVEQIRASGTLGGAFYDDDARLDRWQYGAASSLVEILLRIDAKKYRKLIDGVKEGLSSEESLREAYGFGFIELTQRYGVLARVPNLQP